MRGKKTWQQFKNELRQWKRSLYYNKDLPKYYGPEYTFRKVTLPPKKNKLSLDTEEKPKTAGRFRVRIVLNPNMRH